MTSLLEINTPILSQNQTGSGSVSDKTIEVHCHTLFDKWTLFYHLPNNHQWDLSSYHIIMDSIDTMEKVIVLNEHMGENMIKNCMLFIMRDGITPMWEDPQNRDGGCFSYKVANKVVSEVWRTLFYHLMGESLTISPEKMGSHINGITISPKKNFCIIKIWMNTAKYQDPNIIVNIPNLSQQGCIFRTHTPEF
jgi:hypothetical protein